MTTAIPEPQESPINADDDKLSSEITCSSPVSTSCGESSTNQAFPSGCSTQNGSSSPLSAPCRDPSTNQAFPAGCSTQNGSSSPLSAPCRDPSTNQATDRTSADKQKRICYLCGKGEDDLLGNGTKSRIVRPCCCEGAEQFVHQACLQQKRLESSPWSPAFWECELCGASYRMKYERQLLRVLTSVPALLTVCTLHAVASLLLSAEFFKRAMPTALRWIGELDENAPSSIQLELFGYDLGYWAGGLLNITFLHKMLDRNWTGLIQFLPLFQISIRSTNEEKLSDLRIGVWYFLCLYSCFAACRFVRNSFVIIHRMLRKFIGEEVLDFVGDRARMNSFDEECELPTAEEDTCLYCMELAAQYEMDKCGHLTSCVKCRPRLIYHELKRPRAGVVVSLPPMRLVSNERLENTIIKCPFCRQPGKLVKRDNQARPKSE